MKLYIKQKVFSWGDKFNVSDEQGNPRYFVEGEVFTWGKKLHVYDSRGQEVAFIRQKLLTWLPRYFIEINGEHIATLVKEFTFFKPSYYLEGPPWQMKGDFFAHEYVMYDQQREIMRMSKAWFTWGDSYELEIFDPRNELLCLGVVLAVDCALAQQNQSSGSHG